MGLKSKNVTRVINYYIIIHLTILPLSFLSPLKFLCDRRLIKWDTSIFTAQVVMGIRFLKNQ